MLSTLLLALALGPAHSLQEAPAEPARHTWGAWIDGPGGPIPFSLELVDEGAALQAFVVNSTERRAASSAAWEGADLVVRFDPYDSELRASPDPAEPGVRLQGTWSKRSGNREVELPFHAVLHDESQEVPVGLPGLHGRWAVRFSSSDQPAVLILREATEVETLALGAAAPPVGTFLTTLGDYRYLSAFLDPSGQLVLACFDGAHLFLFRAEIQDDGSLAGDFWSSDTWHETWTAVRDDEAALPDPFGITTWNRDVRLADLVYPDLEGTARTLDDPAFRGKARIVQVFGTWCPNCNDEAPYLAELDRRYRARGLSILGLAFEHGDDHAYAAGRVRSYVERFAVEFPILVAGTSDKQAASEAFPLVDRVRSFPTTLFLDASGKVRAVHTGFSGPATGPEHDKLRSDFERLIETLLAEADDERAR